MNRENYKKPFFLMILLVAVALIAAQCGGAAPTQEPAPAVQEEAQPVEAEAEVVEEEAAAPQDEAVEEEMADEETEAMTEEEAAAVEDENVKIIDESEASRAEQVAGISVTTDEPDVSTPRADFGGTYRDVATSDAVTFHPYKGVGDSASRGYQGLVWVGALLRLDENTLEYIPNMAESYSISEDGLTFTFKLREDLKWSDGEPLTAQDYKWTYDQVRADPEYPYQSQYDFITSYEALDDHTLEIKIDEVYAPALSQMSGLIDPLPKHIWENLDWSDTEKNPEMNNPTVVSGPYKLAEWKRDQYARFEANENYWYHGAPNITEYTIEIVPDSDISYQKMKSGESDTGSIVPENLDEARQLDNINLYEWWPASARWEYIGLNLRDGHPTHDLDVRHALTYAIDKQTLTEEVMLGQAKRLCSTFPETSWVYNPDVPCYEYDPDKAIELLEAAGYTYDGEKMLDENGEQLTLKLIYGPNTNKVRELVAVTSQDYLADVGVKLEVQAMEWASYLEAVAAEEPDWDMYILGWTSPIEPHIMFTIWSEENIPDLNSSAYVNKEVEQLFEEGGATYDTDVRKEKYQEVQRIIAEDSPYIFLWYQKAWSGQNKRIEGIEPTALGIGWNQEDWFIDKAAE